MKENDGHINNYKELRVGSLFWKIERREEKVYGTL